MATPQLASLGSADSLRPSGANLDFSQVVSQAPAGTQIVAEQCNVRIFTTLGNGLSQPMNPQDFYNQYAARGKTLYYLEIWEHDYQIFGTGYIDFTYVAVRSA